MPSAAVTQNIKLWIACLGGRPSGKEERLVNACRARLRKTYADFEQLEIATGVFCYSLGPMLQYLSGSSAGGAVKSWTAARAAEAMYGGFKIICAHTRLAKRFEAVIGSTQGWHAVEKLFQQQCWGAAAVVPVAASPEAPPDANWTAPSVQQPPWWAAGGLVAAAGGAASAAVWQTREFYTFGRYRFYTSLLSAALMLGALYWAWRGAESLPAWMLPSAEEVPEEIEEAQSETSTQPDGERDHVSFADEAEPATGPASALQAMRAEMEAMRADMAALKARPPHVPPP